MSQQADRQLTVFEHLAELRRRIIYSVIALVLTTIVSLIFTNRLFHILIRPAGDIKLIRTEMTEMFLVYLKVSLIAGVCLALPFILYQIIRFVSPGLRPREKRYIFLMTPGVLLAFLAGATFAYFVLLPVGVRYLLDFGSDIATPQIRIGNYISLVTTLLVAMGAVFEMPVAIFLLAKLHIVTPQRLSKWRKYNVLVAFVFSAVITPTMDPLNQALVAAPLIILYEVGILLARLG